MSRLNTQTDFKFKTFEELKNECRYFFSDEKEKLNTALKEKLEEAKRRIEMQNQLINMEMKQTMSCLEGMGIVCSGDFNSKVFDSLPKKDKINFIKIVFGILKEKFFGVLANGFANHAQKYICNNKIIDSFSEMEKFELASEIIRHRGCSFLKEISTLTETQKKNLIQIAEKEVKAWLPILPNELINKFFKEKNLIEIHYLIYQRFSGQFFIYNVSERPEFLNLYTILNSHPFKVHDCINALNLAMLEQEKYFQEKGWKRFPFIKRDIVQWSGKQVEQNKSIPVAHGGGFFHILEFLCGRSIGYKMDTSYSYGICLNVLPQTMQREEFYAVRYSPYHLDIPAKFNAKIETQYLQDMTNFEYEAFIAVDSAIYLNELSLEVYSHEDYLEKIQPSKEQKATRKLFLSHITSSLKPKRTTRIDEDSFPEIFNFYNKIDQVILFMLHNLDFFRALFLSKKFSLINEPSRRLQQLKNALNCKDCSTTDFLKAVIGNDSEDNKLDFGPCLVNGDPLPLKQLLLRNQNLVEAILAFKSIEPCIITKWYHHPVSELKNIRDKAHRERFVKVLKNNLKLVLEGVKNENMLILREGASEKDIQLLWSIFFTMGEWKSGASEYIFLEAAFSKIASFFRSNHSEVETEIFAYLEKIFETNSKFFILLFENQLNPNFKEGYNLLRDIYKNYKLIENFKSDHFDSERQFLKKIFFEIYSFKDEIDPNSKIMEYFVALPEDRQRKLYQFFKSIFMIFRSEEDRNKYPILCHTCDLLQNVDSNSPKFGFLIKTYLYFYSIKDEKDLNDKIIQYFTTLPDNYLKDFFEFLGLFFKKSRHRSLKNFHVLLPKICNFINNNVHIQCFSNLHRLKNVFLKIYSCKSEKDPYDYIFEYIDLLSDNNSKYFFKLFELFFVNNSPNGDLNQGYQLLLDIYNVIKNNDIKDSKLPSESPSSKKVFLKIYFSKYEKNPNEKIIECFREFSEDEQKLLFEVFKPIFMACKSEARCKKFPILWHTWDLLQKVNTSPSDFGLLIRIYLSLSSVKDEKDLSNNVIQYFTALPGDDLGRFFVVSESSLSNQLSFEKALLVKIRNKILELKQRLSVNGLSENSEKILNDKIIHLTDLYFKLISFFSKGYYQDELEKLLENIKKLQENNSIRTFFYSQNYYSSVTSRKSGTLELLDDIEKFIENFWYKKINNSIFGTEDKNGSKNIKVSKVDKECITENKNIKDSAAKHDKLFPIELINLSKQIENLKTRMNNFHSETALKVLKQKQHYLQTTFRLLFNYYMNKSSENLERLATYLESLHGNKIIKTYSYGCFVSSYAFFKPKKTNTEFLLDSINDFVKKADNIRRLGL